MKKAIKLKIIKKGKKEEEFIGGFKNGNTINIELKEQKKES